LCGREAQLFLCLSSSAALCFSFIFYLSNVSVSNTLPLPFWKCTSVICYHCKCWPPLVQLISEYLYTSSYNFAHATYTLHAQNFGITNIIKKKKKTFTYIKLYII
jgi:hypothetical protein